VESKFGVGIGRIEWLHDEKEWSLTGVDGQNLGQFKGLVASDKNIVSPRITQVTGRLPLLGMCMMVFFSCFSLFFQCYFTSILSFCGDNVGLCNMSLF